MLNLQIDDLNKILNTRKHVATRKNVGFSEYEKTISKVGSSSQTILVNAQQSHMSNQMFMSKGPTSYIVIKN